jgi:Flp pilus assembly protein TadG
MLPLGTTFSAAWARCAKGASALSRSLLCLHRDQRGVTAVIVAITLPLLFAFGALAINSGLWFTIKRENQSAADAAALSAAYDLMAGPADACRTDPNFVANSLTPAATQAVAANQHVGWDNTATSTMVECPYNDTLLDTEFGVGKYWAVAVTLRQDQSALFAFAPLTSATIATRSVGVVKIFDTACLLALSRTGTGVGLSGTDSITMPNCSVVADSTDPVAAISLSGSSNITADTVVTAGNISGVSNLTLTSPPPRTFAPRIDDPYQLPACNNNTPPLCLTHSFLTTGPPALSTALCIFSAPSAGVITVRGAVVGTGNCILSNSTTRLTISGAIYDLSPGTYWITDDDLNVSDTGTLECTHCTGGAGVTIIFTTTGANKIGTIKMQPGARITNLNAPNSGTYAGLLFVQDTVGSNPTNGVLGGAGFDGNGLIYLPNTDLEFQGNPTFGCMILVVNTVTLKGASQLSSTGCASVGLNNSPTVKTVVLGE